MAILISQTDVRKSDIRSSVYEAVGKDDDVLKSIEEYVLSCFGIILCGIPMTPCVQLETLVR